MQKSILIIDDEEAMRIMLMQMLGRENYHCLSANNGRQGLEILRKSPVDLVITDIIMPDKEGLETIIDIRKIDSRIPIVAISGGGQLGPHAYLDMALEFGADAVFVKPLERRKFLDAIKQFFED